VHSQSADLNSDVSRLLLVHQVEKILSLKRRTIRYLAQKGLLPAHKIGPKIWSFIARDVLKFKADREAQRV
jgi:hypothetical protein